MRPALMRFDELEATLPPMDRLVVVAPLSPGTGKAAEALISAGPPFDPAATGVTSHSVFLSGGEVVFLFEGPEIDVALTDLVNDPVISASFARWAPLLAGTPRFARETYRWMSQPADADQLFAAPSSSSPRSRA